MKPLTSLMTLAKSLLLIALLAPIIQAQATAVDVSTPKNAVPPNITTSSNKPMMMMATSKDHTLFGPIYTDFEDLDDDGVIDTTFIPTFKYYGYFDPTKCYSYEPTSSQFEPKTLATIVPTIVGTKTLDRYTCPSASSYWSGNFLNWSSMTRLDVVRKMLYGGTRSTDSATVTVLERAKLNWDAHSFVKYYRGTDIRDYTPFTTVALTKTTGDNPNVYAGLSICNTGTADNATTNPNPPVMRMVKGNVRFWATVEIEVCRWTDDGYNLSTFGPKLAAYYKDADKGGGSIAHESALPSKAADGAKYGTIGPELTMRVKVCDPTLLGEERCQPFPPASTTNYKPFGLFQEFGYSSSGGAARAEFGVITGNYDRNYTAGGLRKNMGDFADEIDTATGIFCHSTGSSCPATLPSPDGRATGKGAIKSLDAVRLNDRTSRTYGSIGSPSSIAEGTLSSWGNPIGEMLVQAMQYYANVTSTNPTTTTKDAAVGLSMQAWQDPLSNTNATRKALYGNSICRPMHTLVLSSSALSFDGQAATPFATLPNATGNLDSYTNTIGSLEGLNGTLRSVGSVSGGYGSSCSAKTVGSLSNVSGVCPEAPAMGGTYQIVGAALYGNTSKIRTIATPPADLKFVQNALKVKTLAASLTGGAPRIDIPIPNSNPKKYVYITPESVMASGTLGAPLTFASISSSATHGAFIVTWNDALMGGDYDMDITGFLRYDLVANTASPSGWDVKVTTDIPAVCGGAAGTHGFSIIGVGSANGRYLTHQHNNTGILTSMPPTSEYLCGDTTYRARTGPFGTYASTVCNVTGNGSTGVPTLPTLTSYCTVKTTAYPVSMTFQMALNGAGDALIKDPLWYAAKYGNFDSSTKNGDGTFTDVALPPNVASWDKTNVDGTLGSDGIPDGYFLARRPELLEQQLRRALEDVAKASSAAPAVSSSQLTSGSYKYVAKFDSTTVDGNIEAFKVDADGLFGSIPDWRAGQLLRLRTGGTDGTGGDKGNSRNIITNTGNASSTAIPFRWLSLPSTYGDTSPNHLSAANKELMVNYIRGDQGKESLTGFRMRNDNILGPIVNASPWIQTTPSAAYSEGKFSGYTKFAIDNNKRDKLLWVGANDGMLHAFNPTTGAEVFAYIPGALANRLPEIPMQRGNPGRTRVNNANYTTDSSETQPSGTVWPYVDGSPFTADVKLTTTDTAASTQWKYWKTYAFGSLGRGGKAVYALDVTDVTKLAAAESSSNPQSIFKWQFTSDDDSDLGYLVNDVSIAPASRQASTVAKLNNGKFALILGNGYKSTNGKAALFILYIDGPSGTGSWTGQYKKIIADAGTGSTNYSGLSAATWIDSDANGTADIVYAGDLQGKLWKFDLSSTDDTKWDVAYKDAATNKPLFTAKDGVVALPITTAPEYAYFNDKGSEGLIVTLATGNAFESTDFPNASVGQRIYGIWDRPTFKTKSGELIPSTTPLTTLEPRVYQRLASGNVIVTGTSADIDWSNAKGFGAKDGWYFKLPGSSEMVLSDPDVKVGVLTFTTIRPKTGIDLCSASPDVSLYTLDPVTGKNERNIQGTTDETGTTTIITATAIADQKVKNVVDATNAPFVKPTKTCVKVGGVDVCNDPPPRCGAGQRSIRAVGQGTNANWCYTPGARTQWREIPGIRTDQ